MIKLGITQVQYMDAKLLDEGSFEHRDLRVMDKFTKLAVYTSRCLFSKVKGEKIPSERLGVVIATNTGVYESIKDYNSILSKRGFIGVNPSKFPNVMISTCLSRVVTEIKAKGPSVPLYIRNEMKQALQYGIAQIMKDRCDAVMVLYVNEGKGCFGLFIEREDSALTRGVEARFMYSI